MEGGTSLWITLCVSLGYLLGGSVLFSLADLTDIFNPQGCTQHISHRSGHRLSHIGIVNSFSLQQNAPMVRANGHVARLHALHTSSILSTGLIGHSIQFSGPSIDMHRR